MTTASTLDTVTRRRRAARDLTRAELRAVLSPEELAGVARCAARLRAILPEQRALPATTVLVAYGGGKDSTYMLAFVRAVQLHLEELEGSTFRLRCVTMRHAGMPAAVMRNIDRAYRALRLPDDPDSELLLVDGHDVRPFQVDLPQPAHLVERNRLDILMNGHRTAGDGRPTFCNACNFSVANAYGAGAAWGGGADVIVTGDSRAEQRAYAVWIHRLARRIGRTVPAPRQPGFRGTLQAVDTIATSYFTDLYGGDEAELLRQRRIATEVKDGLRFFSIYDDTHYDAGSHWAVLTSFLGFAFDELAFSFTESDCGNPALMAHLRGLKAEHVFGRDYADGIAEYVDFATGLMRDKDIPDHLVRSMGERYRGADAVRRKRSEMDAYALDTFGLTERQLVCLVHAPFVGKGEHLDRYLDAELPSLAGRGVEARALLAGTDPPPAGSPAAELAATLESASGLPLRLLRVLFASPAVRPPAGAPADGAPGDLIGTILAGDPHKAVIPTRHRPDGPAVHELISGR